jgi:MFS family permease
MAQQPEAEKTQPLGTKVSPLASLGFRDYRLLFIGGFFSGTANQMRQAFNLYLVYDISDSILLVGFTGLFQVIPALTLGLFAGALADVFDRRKLLLIVNSLSMIPAFALGALLLTDSLEVWHIFVFTTLTSLINIAQGPARNSLVPKLVPRTHLMNAVTLNGSLQQATFFIGPLMGGILVDYLGAGVTYIINAFLLLPSMLILLFIRTSGKPEGEARRVSIGMVLDGMKFIWTTRILLGLYLTDFGLSSVGFFRPMLTIMAKDVFDVGPLGLGILYASPAIGAVLGFITMLWIGEVQRKGALFLVAIFLYALGLAFLGLSTLFWMGMIAGAVLGYTDSISLVLRQTLTQLLAPDEYRGRATAFTRLFAQTGNAIGATEAGVAASIMGPGGALILGGAIGVVIVLSVGFGWRGLWRYRSTDS